jgi:NADPH-dependent curcumin reductase CurA
MNRQKVLAKRPNGQIKATDFAMETVELQSLQEGETRLKNQYLSLDAGFRYWMNKDYGNHIYPAMELKSISSI